MRIFILFLLFSIQAFSQPDSNDYYFDDVFINLNPRITFAENGKSKVGFGLGTTINILKKEKMNWRMGFLIE